MSVATPPSHRAAETCVTVALGERSYDIRIGTGLLADPAVWHGLPTGGDALIVCNPVVGALYLQRLELVLAARHARVLSVELPDGEEHKQWQTLNQVFDALLHHGCDRQTTIYALGGGVVGDIAGFAAAAFMRGVPYVQVPTTLLAQFAHRIAHLEQRPVCVVAQAPDQLFRRRTQIDNLAVCLHQVPVRFAQYGAASSGHDLRILRKKAFQHSLFDVAKRCLTVLFEVTSDRATQLALDLGV